MNEEVIIHGGAPMFFHEDGKHRAKQIKVITNDDGAIEILEDGKVWNIDENDEDVQVIEEDGKKVTIKRIKKGDELKVDIEVEEEVEEKK